MAKKLLFVYVPDDRIHVNGFRWLTLEELQSNFKRVIAFNNENDEINYVADVAFAEYIENNEEEQAFGLVTTYRTKDDPDFLELDWLKHD